VLLCLSVQLHDLPGYAAIDTMFFDCENASKHSLLPSDKSRLNTQNNRSRRYSLQAIYDVHCTTEERHDTQIGWQLACRNADELHSFAADNGGDWKQLYEKKA